MNLKSCAQSTHTLVSLPDVVIRINQMIDDPKAQTTDLAEVILYDAGLAARLLRLANSAYYHPRRRIETVSQAITLLGYRELRNLIIATTSVSLFEGLPPELINMDRFWLHSIRCDSAARKLAQHCHIRGGERFLTIGLLHGIGKLVLYSQYPEYYREVLALAGEDEEARVAAERQVFRFTYADLGAELLKSWRFMEQMYLAVAYHLEPGKAPADYRLEATILHVAVQIANHLPAEVDADTLSATSAENTPEYLASLARMLNLPPETLASLPAEVDRQSWEIFGIIRPDAIVSP